MYHCCTICKKDFDVIYVYVIFVTNAMKTLTSSLEGMYDQPTPRWIEANVSNYLINRCLQ